ncbi:MAG: hypothetical protein JNM76_02480 [Betaproteobacteria bacterium]|nr:hypothetical protein [Betaproteobacteria bacterium]
MLATLSAASLTVPAWASATNSGPSMAKPKLKSIQLDKTSYKPGDQLGLTVVFEGKQCVFNLEFSKPGGAPKSIGYFFNNANELEFKSSGTTNYYDLDEGSYQLKALPHTNPGVAGAGAPGCEGGPVQTRFTVQAPQKTLPAINVGAGTSSSNGASAPPGNSPATDKALNFLKPGDKGASAPPGNSPATDKALNFLKPGDPSDPKSGLPTDPKPRPSEGAPVPLKPGGKAADPPSAKAPGK